MRGFLSVPATTIIPAIGFAALASYYVARAAMKSGWFGYHRYKVVAVPLASMPNMPRGFTVRALSPQELSEHTIDVDAAVQSTRFAKGMTCLAAFNSKQQLTGVNWITGSPFLEDEVHMRFHTPIDAAWDTGLWIHQDYRMGRAFAALWAGTGDWMRSNNYQCSMSRIADYNMPAIRSHKRMGAINLGSIICIRILRWQFAAKGRPRVVKVNGNQPAIFYPVVTA
jgi:hypothetical protein